MSQVTYGGSGCSASSLSGYNSSSSYFFLGNEWNFPDSFCSSELGIVDPDPIELFEGLNELPRSIYNDIKKIESDSCPSSIVGGDLSDEYFEHDLKPEIRNIDCMWSGHSAAASQQQQQASPLTTAATTTASTATTIKQNNNNRNTSSIDADQDIDTKYIIGELKVPTALPLSMITGKTTATEINHHNKISQSATTKDLKNKQQQQQQKHHQQSTSSSSAFPYYDLSATIKVEPEEYEEDTSASNCSIKTNKQNQIMQNIPPGTSLLRRKISTAATAGTTSTTTAIATKTFIKKEPQQQQQQQQQFTHHHLPKSKTQKIIYTGVGASNKINTTISSATIPIPNVTASDFIRDREMRVAGVSAGVCSPSLSSTSSANIVRVGTRSVGGSMGGIDATCTSTITTNNGLNIIDGGGSVFNSSTSGSVVFGRPDTPLSLDDDPTEFKHSVDLRACVMGSNNISLVSGGEAIDNDPAIIIRDLREQLEDTSKKQIDIRRILPLSDDDAESRTLADVIAVINDDEHSGVNGRLPSSPMSLLQSPQTNYRTWDTSDDDDDEEEEEGDEDDDDDGVIEDDDGVESVGDSSFGLEKFVSPISQNSHNSPHYPIMHSDHSYTRSKDGVADIGPNLETPSDSDEEIDVVSIGDKKLPTNPSAKDRRVIQTKVAYKFSSSRIVKTPNGIRTILPRRRGSYELPHTPASISPVKSGSPLTSSRYPSPASTPYNNNKNNKNLYSGASCGTATTKKLTSSKFIGQYNNNRVGGGIRSISSSSSSSSASSPTSIIPSTIASAAAATVTKGGPLSIASRKRYSIQAGIGGSIHHNNNHHHHHHHHHRHRRTIVGGGGIGTRIVDDGDDYVPPSKRYRSKRQKQTPQSHLQYYQAQQQQQQQQLQQQQQQQQQQQRNTTIQYNHNRHTLSAAAQNDKSLDSKQPQQQQQHHHHHQHQQYHHRHNGGGGSVSLSGNDDTADTIEKRNLHNDMERQRRIGLKNLFEGLKAQIPSIKDKERAPKVNILREAAKLCESLVREDQRLIEQKAMLKEQLIKRQELLNRLRSSMKIMNN